MVFNDRYGMLQHSDTMAPALESALPAGWPGPVTPFQWGSALLRTGGTRDPMVISWPGHIRDVGGIRSQYTHVIDVLPTILEAAAHSAATSVNGVAQQTVDGMSFLTR